MIYVAARRFCVCRFAFYLWSTQSIIDLLYIILTLCISTALPPPPHTHTCYNHPTPPSSLLTRVEAHYRDPDANPYPGGESEAVFDELTPYLETAGINEPLTKVSC